MSVCSYILMVPFDSEELKGIVYVWVGSKADHSEAQIAEEIAYKMYKVLTVKMILRLVTILVITVIRTAYTRRCSPSNIFCWEKKKNLNKGFCRSNLSKLASLEKVWNSKPNFLHGVHADLLVHACSLTCMCVCVHTQTRTRAHTHTLSLSDVHVHSEMWPSTDGRRF